MGNWKCVVATWFMMSAWLFGQKLKLPVPCTDLVPLDLLEEAAPTLSHLPSGVSIIYDANSHVHAFAFSNEASDLHFKAEKIFKRCEYFPEEFSIFIVLRHHKRPRKEECILSLLDERNKRNIISVMLSRNRVIFQYKKKRFRFKSTIFRDKRWHTLGFSLAGDILVMTTDCGNRRRRRVRRSFPAFLPVTNTSFNIGMCKKKKTKFQGYLKDVILVPGADASVRACPPRKKRRPAIVDNTVSTFPDYYQHTSFWPHRGECTWSDVGNLAFDVHSQQVKVCVNGIWKEASIKTDKKMLDYFDAYQDIVTPAGSIDVNLFTIPGEGMFAVFANAETEGLGPSHSLLFKWTNHKFEMYQRLDTEAAQSWEFFTIRNQFFLAVANYGSSPAQSTNSTVFRWHKKRKKFKVYQTIVTWTARDFEYFEINDSHFLAVANHAEGDNTMIYSVIYRWNVTTRLFEEFQKIMTVGAYDWTHFMVNGFHFLAVANAFNGLSTLIDSVIYFWQNDQFVQFQTMETNGATDWEYFTISDEVFLAVANAYNYGPQNFQDIDTYYTNSTIYRLNKQKKIFEKFQIIPTYSAIDWEYFKVGADHYLVVSNAQNGGTDDRLRSVVYRWQGMDKFVPVHNLVTLPTADWETFTEKNDIFLIYANAKETTSQVLKVKFV